MPYYSFVFLGENQEKTNYFFEPRYVYSPKGRRYMRLHKVGMLITNSTGKRIWCQYPDEEILYDSPHINDYPLDGFATLIKNKIVARDEDYSIQGGSIVKTRAFGEPRTNPFYLAECNLPEEYVAE